MIATAKNMAAGFPWTGGQWAGYEVIAAVESERDATLLVRQESIGDLGIVELSRSKHQFRNLQQSPGKGLVAPLTSKGLDYVFKPHAAAVRLFLRIAKAQKAVDALDA